MTRNLSRLFVLSVACLLMTSCSSMPLFPLPQTEDGQRAQVLVYRSPAFAAGGVSLTVGVDGKAFAYLSQSEYVIADLAPGERSLFVRARTGVPTTYPLSLVRGQRACLKATPESEDIFHQAFSGGAVLRSEGYAFYIVPITCPTADRLGQLTRVSVSYAAS
ncbi:hypothetical protein WG899_11485 [Paucibacter sp. AS339]|uniref:hypothetical protein n=1 Tax=Paucibacter hankyongi TaxID=3133434 RepID=UPI0030B13F60